MITETCNGAQQLCKIANSRHECCRTVEMFCCSNKPEVMELLLKKSTSGMNAVNKTGRTSLHVAVCKQNADCVRLLLKYRCDVNVQVIPYPRPHRLQIWFV